MSLDDHIRQTIEIGERNAEVMVLIQNWCAHARTEIVGGVGFIEQQTGLPIGMRRLTCDHQRAPGQASMNLGANALDFYDRNCVNCTMRQAVRLPNISELVADRERSRAENQRRARAAHDERLSSLEKRREVLTAERELLSSNRNEGIIDQALSYATDSILEQLIKFDSNPDSAGLHHLVESARAVPNAFNKRILQLVAMVASVGGDTRTQLTLDIHSLVAPESRETYETAMLALGRGDQEEFAGSLVAGLAKSQARSDGSDAKMCADAAPAAIWLCRSHRPIMQQFQPPQPEAFLALYRAHPQEFEISTRRALRHSEKEFRRAGAFAVHALIGARMIAQAIAHAPDLLAGFGLPDDSDQDGDAGRVTAWVLGELLLADAKSIYPLLNKTAAEGGSLERIGVLRIYKSLFDVYNRHGNPIRRSRETRIEDHPARQTALSELIDTLARLPEDHDLLDEAINFFRHDHNRVPPEMLVQSVDAFLGIAMLAIENRHKPISRLHDARSPEARAWEQMGRDTQLKVVKNCALETIVYVGTHHDSEQVRQAIIRTVIETLDTLSDGDEEIRGDLVRILGELASDAQSSSHVLPSIYSALTANSQIVRAQAAEAYGALVKRCGAENLPSLLHDSFLNLLQDPYVAVHGTALRALESITLPSSYDKKVAVLAWVLANAHRQTPELNVSALALRITLDYARGTDSLTDALRDAVVALLRNVPAYDATDFVKHNRRGLRGAKGYATLVVKLIEQSRDRTYVYDDLLDELESVDQSEIFEISAEIVETSRKILGHEFWRALRFLRILMKARCWEPAERLAQIAIEGCADARKNYPIKLQLQRLLALIELEIAAISGNVDAVSDSVAAYSKIELAISADKTENQESRGFRFPSF